MNSSALIDIKEGKKKKNRAMSEIQEHHCFRDVKSALISQGPMAKLREGKRKETSLR